MSHRISSDVKNKFKLKYLFVVISKYILCAGCQHSLQDVLQVLSPWYSGLPIYSIYHIHTSLRCANQTLITDILTQRDHNVCVCAVAAGIERVAAGVDSH